jgi:hypothetical protein
MEGDSMQALPERGDRDFRARMFERAVWAALAAALTVVSNGAIDVAITKADKYQRVRESRDNQLLAAGEYLQDRLRRDAALELALLDCMQRLHMPSPRWGAMDAERLGLPAEEPPGGIPSTDAVEGSLDLDEVATAYGYTPE